MQIQTKKFAGLTGNQLKLLALIAMTCDHVGLQLLPQFIILRIIGRLAAPLFAYMIAEGCRYTHNRGRYLGRLLGMAALCQIAYFAAMRSLYQCIFVTFSLSVCMIYALDNAVRRRTPVSVLSAAAAVAAVVFVTEGLPRILIHTDFDVDYGLWGVMLPVLVYFGRGKWGRLALFAVGVSLLGLQYGGAQWWGASERSPSGAVQRQKRHMEYRPAVLLVLPRPFGRDLRPEPASDTRRRITYRPGNHPRYIRRK